MLAALLTVLFSRCCHSQYEPLHLVESTPSVAQKPIDSNPGPHLFIKQPSKKWLPEPLFDGGDQLRAQHPQFHSPSLQGPTGTPIGSKLHMTSDVKTGRSSSGASNGNAAILPSDDNSPYLIGPLLQSSPLSETSVLNSGPQPSTISGAVSSYEQTTPDNSSASTKVASSSGSANKSTLPSFFLPPQEPVQFDCYGQATPYTGSDFSYPPISGAAADPLTESLIYRGKSPVQTQRPWVELGRPLYTAGIYPPASSTFFGETNLLQPHFWVYGDYRTGVGVNENQDGSARSWGHRLNLDMDWQFTATERIHAFMGPLDRTNDITRIDFSDSQNIEYVNRTDIRLDTLFFEGDAGAIIGGREGTYSPFDLPFTFGLMPLVYQNGIWMEDAALGAAFAIPAQHSAFMDWPNYEMTFFALTDQVTSDAFPGDNNAAETFGTAWFIEAYDGYIEADYAFIHDDSGAHRSYHNASISFTRRYFYRVSNSVRLITNFDQALPKEQRTADGYLILLENSLITSNANFFVPYANFFYGSGKPQSVARAAPAGGILRNTGINFETDALTGYPTLDATGNNTYGAAFGLNILGNNFSHQLVLELAALGATGSNNFRSAPGNQYAAGVRYQKPLSHRWIFRADSMYGWLDNSEDIYGNRIEFRWKF